MNFKLSEIEENDEVTVYRYINLSISIDKSYVEINPVLLPSIKDYKVSTNFFFFKNWISMERPIEYTPNGYYCTENSNAIEIEHTYNKKAYSHIDKRPVVPYLSMREFPETYVNVQVEIEFNDGNVFSSSRVFKFDGKIVDNTKDILSPYRNVLLF